ncbi:MAG: MipA/OmpV family protein [Lentisphaerae bacterium]|nr:MipA/OmpV family protein [Lentisphaerota bacterium]
MGYALFDSANTFGDLRDPVRMGTWPLDGRELFCIGDLSAGNYALLVYLDENDNCRLDRNFIGIPREPLAFSNGYRPKGPPSYRRAAFELTDEEARRFDVTLRRPLGERGRIGVGIGAIIRSSPYRDYEGSVFQLIPAITYIGNRLQILGPNLQLGLVGQGKLRLAATAQYRIGAYEERESDVLTGMGDRENTLLVGLALLGALPGGVDVSLRYAHDVLDRIGGGAARMAVEKSFQLGRMRGGPELGLNWQSRGLALHDYGVPSAMATPQRPAHTLNDTLSVTVGLRLFADIAPDWVVVLNTSLEFLDESITTSPIVNANYVIQSFVAVNYVF